MTSEPSFHKSHSRFSVAQTGGLVAGVLLLLTFAEARADQVEMQNGDRYFGRVVSLDTNQLVMQSEVVGTLRLPRAQVAVIQFGARAAAPGSAGWSSKAGPTPGTNGLAGAAAPVSGTSPEMAAALKQLGAKTNLIQQVQKQFLSDAGPEANQQFNDLVSGLMSGKLNVNDLRAQARSMADQVRAAQKDLGEDAGWATESYLAILDHFLKETAAPPSAPSTTTNAPKAR